MPATLAPLRIHDLRRHPRAPLSLPVRLRWLTPLGQLVELTETLDLSRGGLLASCRQPCPPHALLWVTFPYDPAADPAPQETPARVARIKQTPSGGHLVAVKFVRPRPSTQAPLAGDRRSCERFPLALPIRVRAEGSPWPEETMTVDVSEKGVLFCTARLYAVGAAVHVVLSYARWAAAGEVLARVVRLARQPGSVEQQVGLVLA